MSEHVVTVSKQAIAIQPIPISAQQFLALFAQLSHYDHAILFDSADAGAKGGRYSIAAWGPLAYIETRAGKTTIFDGNAQQPVTELPLAAAWSLFQQYQQQIDTHVPATYQHLPFLVGMAGLCGYDLGRVYEDLPSIAQNNYHCPEMALAFYPQSVIYDHQQQRGYYCHLSSVPALDWQALLATSVVTAESADFVLTEAWHANMNKAQYEAAIARIQQYLYAGDCYQINFAQRFTAPYSGEPWQAYLRLRAQNQSPFSCFMRVGESYILSLSPERFLAVQQGRVETKPIKGTRPRHPSPQQDAAIAQQLLTADKDRAENLMIVDLLRNDLSKHCLPHSVKVPHLFALESYDAVHHMVSTVVGTLAPTSHPFALFAGAFPGGSITGAPKIRAMEIIEELEPHQRNIYCGSMLYLGVREDMDSSICIRTLLAEQGLVHCWAGGGIVMDSKATEEYQETLDKVAKILPVLGTFDAT